MSVCLRVVKYLSPWLLQIRLTTHILELNVFSSRRLRHLRKIACVRCVRCDDEIQPKAEEEKRP